MLRVLIIDDDTLFGRAVARRLENNQQFSCKAKAVAHADKARESIREAAVPFDVFLVEQHLGTEWNGTELLSELRTLSPLTEVIVFTRLGDDDAALRDYHAETYPYLHKPIDSEDMLAALRSLDQWRTSRECDSLRTLIAIAEQTQQVFTVAEVGDVIVQGAQQLGFERAQLWHYDPHNDLLVGVSQLGNPSLTDVTTPSVRPSDSSYLNLVVASAKPVVFHEQEHGPSWLFEQLNTQGFQPAKGDWIGLPLRVADQCVGIMMLDNFSTAQSIPEWRLQELTLFSKYVAVALDRANAYQREVQQAIELSQINEIGRSVTALGATGKLERLLQEVRFQIGKLMDVSNFMIVLYDGREGLLDFRLKIEHNRRCLPYQRSAYEGLVGHVIENNIALLLPRGGEEYRGLLDIPLIGNQSRCWLGVPLRLDDRPIGAIVVQSYTHEYSYTSRDRRLLVGIADQVAGAIQTARLKDEASDTNRRLEVLQHATEEFMLLADEGDDWHWHAALTVTTAGYGLGFNRAMLFLTTKGGSALLGRMGIGQVESPRAHQDWERDLREKMSFRKYLAQLRADSRAPSQVDQVLQQEFDEILLESGAFSKALHERKRVIVSQAHVTTLLPTRFVQHFGVTNYAVLPIHVGRKQLGLLVVDNIHNQEAIQKTRLDQLETLLAQVALVHEHHRQRKASDQLAEVSRQVLARAADRLLKETLDDICSAAQVIADADNVLIYPFVPNVFATEPRYDTANAGYIGLRQPFYLHDQPDSNGTTMRLIENGEVVLIDNVARTDWFSTHKVKRSVFLKRERVRAFIAVPIINEQTGTALGALYLNYCTPQRFGDLDKRRAQSFAELAGAAIRTAREGAAGREGLRRSEQTRRAHVRELEVLRKVLETAAKAGANHDQVAHSLLAAAQKLLGRPGTQVGLVLREWVVPDNLVEKPYEQRRQYFTGTEGQPIVLVQPELELGLVGGVLLSGKEQLIGDVLMEEWQTIFQHRYISDVQTRSELDVPIKLEGRVPLGVFNLESPIVNDFTHAQRRTLRRLAAVAALVLDTVRRQANLHDVLAAAQAVMSAQNLDATLSAVLQASRKIAVGVSTITIWYKDFYNIVRLGPHFGVDRADRMKGQAPPENSTVLRVMQSHEPIWATDVLKDEQLGTRFIGDEGIRATAALPLPADGQVIGAIFFSYRESHTFSDEEKVLFRMLAAIAAASIRDAVRLEAVRRERERLRVAQEITETIGTRLNLQETLQGVLAAVKTHFTQAFPCVLIYNDRRQELEFAPASLAFYPIEHPEEVTILKVSENRSIACRIARKALQASEPIWDNQPNVLLDSHYIRAMDRTCSQLTLAMLNREKKLLGILVLESPELNAFDEEDVELFKTVGHSVSVAIDRAYQSAELRFERAIATATTWVAEFAHDMKAEIAKIRRYAYLLHPELPHHLQEQVYLIDQSAARLSTLARAPRAQELTAIAIDSWLREKILVYTVARNPAITLNFFLNSPNSYVSASPVLLDRVIRHLIRNALEAMEDQANCQIIVRTARREGMIEVHIANTGPDVPEDVQQLILLDQVSSKGTVRDGIEGVEGGLGLLFVRWAVETMGGWIEFLPKQGDEVTFAFALPLIDAPHLPYLIAS